VDEIGRSLFGSLITELFIVVLAIVLRDDKRKVAAVLAIGTLIAGLIGFRQSIFQSISQLAKSLPFATEEQVLEFTELSLKPYSELSVPETNLELEPTDGIILLEVPFEIGWKASTQCSHLPNQPESFQIGTLIQRPESVFVLLQAGWALSEYGGLNIGLIRLVFSNSKTLDDNLILGINIRDWAWEDSSRVNMVSSPLSRTAWSGHANNGTFGGIDMLTITIPKEYQDSDLTAIQFFDFSDQTANSINPCLHIVAVTVRHWR